MGVRTDRLNSLGRGWNGDVRPSDSSLAGGVSGGVSGCGVGCGDMVILRISDTAVVASAAISLTKYGDVVFVANTTKYGIELQRENDRGRGSVTCDGYHQSRLQNQATYALTAQLNGIGRSGINAISSQDSGFITEPSTDWKSVSGRNNTGASNLEELGEIPPRVL